MCSDRISHIVRRFVKWTQNTFRSGGHQAELLPLLERCTRELQHIHKYKSDIRYLRIWIQYVRCAATVLQPALQSYKLLLTLCRLTVCLSLEMSSTSSR